MRDALADGYPELAVSCNITSKSDIGTYTYPPSGQPHPHGVTSITPTNNQPIPITYDSVGKITSDGLTQDSFTYLPFQMPRTVTHTGGDTLTMQYDADHHRVSRKVAGAATTYYLPDGEATVSGGVTQWRTYYMGEKNRIADESGATGSLTHLYYLNDDQNSIGVVVDDTGAVKQNRRRRSELRRQRRRARGLLLSRVWNDREQQLIGRVPRRQLRGEHIRSPLGSLCYRRFRIDREPRIIC